MYRATTMRISSSSATRAAGFYVAFIFPVLAALVVRLKGQWKPGPFSLGVLGPVVNVAALLWLGFEIVNIAWPRQSEAPWYQNYAVVVVFVILAWQVLRWRGTCVDAMARAWRRRQSQRQRQTRNC